MVEGGAASEQGAVGAAAKQSRAGDDAAGAGSREVMRRVTVGRAQSQSQGRAAVGVSLSGVRGLVGIVRAPEYLLHGVQVLAHLHVDWDAHTGRSLKGLTQTREDKALKGRRKGAELNLAKLVTLRMPAVNSLTRTSPMPIPTPV